ncbi:MAG: histidine phosphatase family protein [Ktedonobacteraceae bacterium]|nr:histidine phosphatase family protein [Ktedonobacteraceae bacterium]MBO0789972.1 histidine phosphatase family protein [Ktedonobacteraceae bacterium]
MNTVYLVRHGENTANLTHEFSYKVIDYSLTPKGVLQAQQTAEFFKDKAIDEIYASPLKRAHETANIIGQAVRLSVTTMEQLREVNVGDLELQPPTEENWIRHNTIISGWLTNRPEVSFPNGENYPQLLQRWRSALSQILEGKSGKNIVIVAHGGIFTIPLRDICSNVSLETTIRKTQNNNCSVTIVELEMQDGLPTGTLRDWALCTHLTGEAANFVAGNPYPKHYE